MIVQKPGLCSVPAFFFMYIANDFQILMQLWQIKYSLGMVRVRQIKQFVEDKERVWLQSIKRQTLTAGLCLK